MAGGATGVSPRAHLYSGVGDTRLCPASCKQAAGQGRPVRQRTSQNRLGRTASGAIRAPREQKPSGPRPLPVHRYTVERVVIGRTRKVIEAELEVTFGPLLGSLTIKPFTSCPAGRSPIDRGRSLHRTGRGRIEENVIGYRRGGVRQLDSVAHCPLPNTKAR